jgi:hypothetical protein
MANTKVTGDLIASSTIATGNIADNAVTSDKISGITTAHIAEGSNLYYTDARADARVALIVDSAPATLDTLNELAAALGDDPNFATTTANSIGLKAPLASPSFTGNATFGGNVGIGTGNTIYADLEVKRAGEVTLALHNSSAITSGNRGNLAFYNSSVSTVATIRAAADTDNVGTALEFYTRPVGGSLTNSMTIDSSGKSTFYSNEIEVYASSSSASLILNSGDATKDEWTIVTTDLAGDAYLRFVDTTTATTVMSLRDNGNLGIGTNSPDVKLDIRNGELIVRPSATGFGGAGKIGHSSSNAILQLYDSSGNEDVRISTSLSSYFNGGNVGIGTDSPTDLLTLEKTDTNSVQLVIDNNNTSDAGTETSKIRFRHYRSYVAGLNDAGEITVGKEEAWDASGDRNSYMSFGTRNGTVGVTERMRIDSLGNVGIGTTSPGDYNVSDNPILAVGNTATANNSSQISVLSGSSGFGYLLFGDGETGNEAYRGQVRYGHTNDSLEFVTAGTERMRIDSSKMQLTTGATNQAVIQMSTNSAYQIRGGGNYGYISLVAPILRFDTNGTERMRITSDGDVLFGTQGLPNGTSVYGSAFTDETSNRMILRMASSTTGAVNLVQFYNGNGLVGKIQTNGSATSYITSSDYRLKENVVEMTGALDRVSQLKPSRFNFIADADKTVDGFLAHEVQEIVPEAITGEKDAVDEEGNPEYQGIDQSKLVPLLVGAIQELKAEIETLKLQINN